MENKELKMKLGQLQEEISKASFPVSTDLNNDFKSINLETEQIKNFVLHEVILGRAAKISTILSKRCYVSPHEP